MNNDDFDQFKRKLLSQTKSDDGLFVGDDSSFNFRVNKDLKEQFAQLCKKERLSAAVILKRYMIQCIENGKITL